MPGPPLHTHCDSGLNSISKQKILSLDKPLVFFYVLAGSSRISPEVPDSAPCSSSYFMLIRKFWKVMEPLSPPISNEEALYISPNSKHMTRKNLQTTKLQKEKGTEEMGVHENPAIWFWSQCPWKVPLHALPWVGGNFARLPGWKVYILKFIEPHPFQPEGKAWGWGSAAAVKSPVDHTGCCWFPQADSDVRINIHKLKIGSFLTPKVQDLFPHLP